MGCGKAYLTFALYYYLRGAGYEPEITGIDLKADVIAYCNSVAGELGADGLTFRAGDIAGFGADGDAADDKNPPDMVVALHACDTATDYALYHAVRLGARVVLAAPCCQHELFSQIANNDFNILLKYGIIKEKFSALLTDALRGAILECCGYSCRIVEFIDTEHTPKNILLEAVKSAAKKEQGSLARVEEMMRSFNVKPKLYSLLEERMK
jgi:hypothetical protein